MSTLTREYFLRLHIKMSRSDLAYRKGYEYAKKLHRSIDCDTETLKALLKIYSDIATKEYDSCAMGHAHAIREILWERLSQPVGQAI